MIIPAGRAFIIDHKTTSSDIGDGSAFWNRLRMDAQLSTYLVGARALGFDPVGAVWDVIHKPSVKPLKATPVDERKYTKATKTQPSRLYASQAEVDEPLDEYRARLAADIAARPDAYYKRGFIVRTLDEERAAAFDAWGVGMSIEHSALTASWPRTPAACERYGSLCPYFDVCTGAASLDDGTRYRRTRGAHEELTTRRKLPLITTSAMTTYQRCAREYQFSYVHGVRPIKVADALAFGTLLHLGLEVWWKTTDLQATFAALVTDDPVHRVVAEELLRGYDARWSAEPLDVLAVEAEFATPLVDPLTHAPSTRHTLGGKIDAVARVTETTAGSKSE